MVVDSEKLRDYVITLKVSSRKSKEELQKLWKKNQHRFPLPLLIKNFKIEAIDIVEEKVNGA